jgi:hypothetical protein
MIFELAAKLVKEKDREIAISSAENHTTPHIGW